MSKRVANKKGRSRVAPARSMIRLGWRKKRNAALLYELKGRMMRGDSEIRVL